MSITKGSCKCGEYQWEAHGDPVVLKAGGTNGTPHVIFKEDDYRVIAGKEKKWTRIGDSGQEVTDSFCDTCCTFMSVSAKVLPGVVIVKTGTVDGPSSILDAKPSIEIYTRNRPNCFPPLGDAAQVDGQPQQSEV